MTSIGENRPGSIQQVWAVHCDLCGRDHNVRSSYQEASIWLTSHLDDNHPTWDEPLPEQPGYYLVDDPDYGTAPVVVERLHDGRWVDCGDRNYLTEAEVRPLAPLHLLLTEAQWRSRLPDGPTA